MKEKLVTLALILFPLLGAAQPVNRQILLIRQGVSADTVRTYLKSRNLAFKEIKDYNRSTRAFVTWITDGIKSSILSHFNTGLSAQISFQADHSRTPHIKSKGLSASSSTYGSLNNWAINRIGANAPDLTRRGGSAILDTRTEGALPGPLPNTDGLIVCDIDSGISWDHPDLADRIVGQFNSSYDPNNSLTCDTVWTSDGKQYCSGMQPPGVTVLQTIPAPPQDLNRYCLVYEKKDAPDTDPDKYALCAYSDPEIYDYDPNSSFEVDHGSRTAGLIFGENRYLNEARVDFQGVATTVRAIVAKAAGWHWEEDFTQTPDANGNYPYAYTFGYYYESDVAAAIGECMFQGARVINMSFGGDIPSEIEHMMIAEGAQNGTIFVASAGNACITPSGDYGCFNNPTYPAAYPEVIAVAALGLDGNIAPWSRVAKVDAIAPGVSVLSTTKDAVVGYEEFSDDPSFRITHRACVATAAAPQDCQSSYNNSGFSAMPLAVPPGGLSSDGTTRVGTFDYADGTSFSSPLVAGAVARALSLYPWLTADEALRGQDIGLDRTQQGEYGLISVYEAMH